MHQAAYLFVAKTLESQDLAGVNVLEIGSYNVNGSVRPLFGGARAYTGIDVRSGQGVDIVCDCASYDGQERFDLVVSTEVLEHMPRPADLIHCAWRSLRNGGHLILTAAGPNRAPHGVDGGTVGSEPYQNSSTEALAALLADWADVLIMENPTAGDIYATATKPRESSECAS